MAFVQLYIDEFLSLNSPSYVSNYISISFFTLALTILSSFFIKFIFFNNKELPIVSFDVQIPEEAKPHWKGKRLPIPSLIDPNNPEIIQSYCPATGQYLGSFTSFNKTQIDQSINEALDAKKEWSNSTFKQRKRVLRSLSEYILKNQHSIARVACRDSGKTMIDASMGEIFVTLEKINWILKHGERILNNSNRPGPSNLLMFYKKAQIRYYPLNGLCAALISWNYPFHNLMGPIIASIFTGNAIIIKCSESVIWSSNIFIKIVKNCLIACNQNPNLVQLIYTWPNVADYFTSHPSLSHITFIGSRPVAHHVVKAASVSLTPVVLELGGKDPFIVLEDAKNLDQIASIIMRGSFQSAGQNCIGIERVIIVGDKNYNYLSNILFEKVKLLRLGSDIDQLEEIDMGAIITNQRFEDLELRLKKSVEKGAKILYGGHKYNHPNYPQGHYFSPTLIVDVTKDMDIATEENFAPILTILKADDTNDAIEIANSNEYGLGASVFGENWKNLNFVVDSLKSGNVAVNDFATFYLCQLPFGGCKGSGYGKFNGEEGLRGLCIEKSVCYDKFPFIKTQIPKPIDYPINDEKKAWNFVSSLSVSGYSTSLWSRAKSVVTLAKNAS
ncbi:meiotic recombination directing protein [Ascoidea rubescens DSM 1968]|uniref:ALDH-like protein n=1 Tax=Ascoidea rubescens DSM 1968 TaxID=1344418 RepID=A0A1D2VET8_9ASCO|nr:ALDH-like protein [Ascoidea rubescens DSM 1968]ODV60146.1 ALDH-like protein [Ascoidea rubescens DSM 1968]